MKFTKKLLAAAVVLMILLSLATGLVIANENDNITVTVDGTPITFEDQGPVIVNGRTLVPVRGVFETMGFSVAWENDTQTATLTKDSDVVIIIIDNIVFASNGVGYELEVPAQIIGGRTMLPIRAVLESVGYSLDWDGDTRTVIITAGNSDTSGEAEDLQSDKEEPMLAAEPFVLEAGTCFRAFAQGPAAVPMPIYITILENDMFEVWSGSPADGGIVRSRGTFAIDKNNISFSQLLVLPAEAPVPDGLEAYVFLITSTDEDNNVTGFSIDNGIFRWPLPTMPPVSGSGADSDNNPVESFQFDFIEL